MREEIALGTFNVQEKEINRLRGCVVVAERERDNREKEVWEMLGTLGELRARIKTLETAIADHRRQFPDEPMPGELTLWAHVSIDA